LIGNGSVNTPVVRQWISSRYAEDATDTYAKIQELLLAVFSVRSVAMLYNEDQLPLRESSETAIRRAGVWCEMVASSEREERPLLEDITKQRSEDRD
jgi:hypothetical protein